MDAINYEQQAIDFANKFGVELSFIGKPNYKIHFVGETQRRWVFKCRLKRNGLSYTFDFGQSIADGSKQPSLYVILACLIKYDPDSFENFCGDFGYDSYDKSSKKIYNAVVKEWENVERLFGDILDELHEIA